MVRMVVKYVEISPNKITIPSWKHIFFDFCMKSMAFHRSSFSAPSLAMSFESSTRRLLAWSDPRENPMAQQVLCRMKLLIMIIMLVVVMMMMMMMMMTMMIVKPGIINIGNPSNSVAQCITSWGLEYLILLFHVFWDANGSSEIGFSNTNQQN